MTDNNNTQNWMEEHQKWLEENINIKCLLEAVYNLPKPIKGEQKMENKEQYVDDWENEDFLRKAIYYFENIKQDHFEIYALKFITNIKINKDNFKNENIKKLTYRLAVFAGRVVENYEENWGRYTHHFGYTYMLSCKNAGLQINDNKYKLFICNIKNTEVI